MLKKIFTFLKNFSKMSPLLVQGAKFYKVIDSNFRVGNFQTGIIQLFTKVERKQNNFRLCDPPYCTWIHYYILKVHLPVYLFSI